MLNVPWTVWERSAAEYRGLSAATKGSLYALSPVHPSADPLSCSPAAAPAFSLNMGGLNARFLPSYWLVGFLLLLLMESVSCLSRVGESETFITLSETVVIMTVIRIGRLLSTPSPSSSSSSPY